MLEEEEKIAELKARLEDVMKKIKKNSWIWKKAQAELKALVEEKDKLLHLINYLK